MKIFFILFALPGFVISTWNQDRSLVRILTVISILSTHVANGTFQLLIDDFKVHRYRTIISNPLPRWFQPVTRNQGMSGMVKREVTANNADITANDRNNY